MRCNLTLVLLSAALSCPLARAQADRSSEGFQLALGMLQRGLFDEAAKELERFVQKAPAGSKSLLPEAWYRLGTCRLELKQQNAARDAFAQALSAGDFALKPECRYRLGLVLHDQKEHEAASQQLDALVKEAAKDHYLRVPASYARAECLRDLGRDDAAVGAFLSVAKEDAGKDGAHAVPALHEAGLLLLKKKDHTGARAAFAEAATRWPEHKAAPECRLLEGEAALRAGDFDAAAAAFTSVAKGKGGEGTAERATADRATAERATDGLGRAAVARIRDLQQKGDQEQVADAAARALGSLELAPATRADLLEAQGQALLRLQKLEPAEKALAEASRLATEPALRGDALFGLCVARHQQGRHDAALTAANDLLALEPAHRLAPRARFAVGECRFAKKEWELADKAYAACDDQQLAPKVAFKRAWCSYLQGQAQEAAQRFQTLSGSPDAVIAEEALAMSALCALEADRPDEALAAADHYRARYAGGKYLARSERIAARVLEKKGDLKGASARLANASSSERGTERARQDELERAELAFRQGDYESARTLYEPLAGRTDALGGKALAGLAWCSFELGDTESCKRRIGQALAHPALGQERAGILELQTALAEKALAWPDVESTTRAFLNEFGSHARAPEMRLALAVALARQGKDKEARTELLELRGKGQCKRMDRVAHELGWVHARLGEKAPAQEAFAKVVETTKDEDLKSEAGLQLGILLLADPKADAACVARGRDVLGSVAGKHVPDARYRLGTSWFQQQEWAKAAGAFEQVQSGAMLGEAQYLAAESRMKAGDHAAAAKDATALLEREPDHVRAHAARLVLGLASLSAKDADRAVAALEKYLHEADQQDPERARAELALGKARLSRKEHDKAEAAFARATEVSENEIAAEAQFLLGASRKGRRDVEGAAEAWVKLSILYGHERWVEQALLEAGRCYQELGQPAKAKKLLQELVDRYPQSQSARDAKKILGV